MFRILPVFLLAVMLWLPAFAAPTPTAPDFTVDGAFRVSRPSTDWVWLQEASDTHAVSLERRSLGLEVMLRWVTNKTAMDSAHMARLLRAKLMRVPTAVGHKFSILHNGTVGGLPSATFSEEQQVKRSLHRTEYTLVAQGKKGLLVAAMGPAQLLKEHETEVQGVLQSISFLAAK